VTFPEYGTGYGRVDFYIPAKEWGVELLCNGDRLAERSVAFQIMGHIQLLFLSLTILFLTVVQHILKIHIQVRIYIYSYI